MGKNISRPKQVTDWVARLEKLEQMLAAESGSTACSCSQLGSRRMCQTFAPPIHWSGKYRLRQRFIDYSRQTEAGVARTLISRLKAAEFLALRGAGVDHSTITVPGVRIASACPLTVSLTTHRDPRRGLGRAWCLLKVSCWRIRGPASRSEQEC